MVYAHGRAIAKGKKQYKRALQVRGNQAQSGVVSGKDSETEFCGSELEG
jgi:hypothetical protein